MLIPLLGPRAEEEVLAVPITITQCTCIEKYHLRAIACLKFQSCVKQTRLLKFHYGKITDKQYWQSRDANHSVGGNDHPGHPESPI